MDKETLTWVLPLALGVLGFLLGAGWPAKTYGSWSDARLHKRLDDRYVLKVLYDADQRENAMRHDRSDEMMQMIRDIQIANNSLTLSVERHTVAFEYWGAEMKEMKEEVEAMQRNRGREG